MSEIHDPSKRAGNLMAAFHILITTLPGVSPSAKPGFSGAAPDFLHLWKRGWRGFWFSSNQTAATKARIFLFKTHEHLWSCATLNYLAGISET